MQRSASAQMRILKLIELLSDGASRNEPLRSSSILRSLEKQGMCITRTTLKNDIALLRECGIDVQSATLPSGEHYYINSSGAAAVPPVLAHSEIYDSIAAAIRAGRKLAVTLDADAEFTVSPYAVVRNDGGYHAACFSPAHRRVVLLPFSKISAASPTAEPSDSAPPDYSVTQYTMRGFELCLSVSESVTLSFDTDMLGSVLSQFGDRTAIIREPSGLLRAEVSTEVSSELFAWLFPLGGRVRIIAPEHACCEYKSCLRAQLAAY